MTPCAPHEHRRPLESDIGKILEWKSGNIVETMRKNIDRDAKLHDLILTRFLEIGEQKLSYGWSLQRLDQPC